MTDHFSVVARRYRQLRTTDTEPVRYIEKHLPVGPSLVLDVGCGTGRYTQLVYGRLPEGSGIIGVDGSMEMLRVLRSMRGSAERVSGVAASAEALPLRPRSVDWAVTFNAVHHFHLATFLAPMANVLKAGSKLFIYTRTPEQNARSVWGRLFPDFAQKEIRLRSESQFRAAIEETQRLALQSIEAFRYPRTSTPARLRQLAEHAHYSTFRLYEPEEFAEALRIFLKRLPHPDVSWTDENIMLVCESSE
jgi:SAM-dependent methyltransferase